VIDRRLDTPGATSAGGSEPVGGRAAIEFTERSGLRERNTWKRLLGPIFTSAASAVVHLVFFFVYFDGALRSGGDTPVYEELSRGFWTSHGMTLGGTPSATYPPVYPAFLAALAPGSRPGALLATAQLLVSASIAGAVYSIARYWFGGQAPLFAGILSVVAPQLPFWAGFVLSDTLGIALGIWGVWGVVAALACAATERKRNWKTVLLAAVGGILVALAILTRPLNAPALLFTSGGLFWTVRNGRYWPKWDAWDSVNRAKLSIVRLGLVFSIAMSLPIAVWTTRNAIEMKAFIPLSTRAGWQLWQGVLWDLHGRGTVGKDVYYPDEAGGMGEVEADRYLIRRSLSEIQRNPARFAQKFSTKVAFLWLPTAPGLGLGMLLSGMYFWVVAGLTAVAVLATPTHRGVVAFGLGALGVTVAVGVTILDPDYRYRLPLLVLLLAPAGCGLEVLWDRMRRLYSLGAARGVQHDRNAS